MWAGALSEACKLGSVRLRRTLGSPGLSWREDPLPPRSSARPLADSEPLLLTLSMESGQRPLPFLPIQNPRQTAEGVLGTGPGTSQLPSLTPARPGYSQSARRRRMEAGGCVRGHPASGVEWACAAPRRCSAAPPQ